jgi:hypothetical protein
MALEDLDLVTSLHALPETDPLEIEGIQWGRGNGRGGGRTCNSRCTNITANVIQTVCVLSATC